MAELPRRHPAECKRESSSRPSSASPVEDLPAAASPAHRIRRNQSFLLCRRLLPPRTCPLHGKSTRNLEFPLTNNLRRPEKAFGPLFRGHPLPALKRLGCRLDRLICIFRRRGLHHSQYL